MPGKVSGMEWGDAYHRLVLPSPFSCKGETLTSSVHLGRLGSGRRKRGLGWAQGQEEGGKSSGLQMCMVAGPAPWWPLPGPRAILVSL